MAVLAREVGSKVCEALGLDPAKVTVISFLWEAEGVAKIRFTQLVTSEDGDAIAEILSEYELVEKGVNDVESNRS